MQTFRGLGGGFYKYISMAWISWCYRDSTERFPFVKGARGMSHWSGFRVTALRTEHPPAPLRKGENEV